MTEEELIKGCIARNAGCQRMLFEQYAGRMMTICRRYASDQQEAEDMLQEAFTRVFQYIGQYKQQGTLAGWIRRVTVNAALRELQTRKIRFSTITDDRECQYTTEDLEACSHLEAEELLHLIHELPEGYRIVFNLYALEGYSHDEIADMLQIKPVTSRTQLLKARKWLQEKIQSMQKAVR